MRILYIDIDSLRPDHLGCYGYGRNTSPNIDRIAAEGVRFNRCYTSDAPCLPSRTALFSGRFGIHNGVVNHGGAASEPFIEGPSRGFRSTLGITGWMSRLKEAGFNPVTVSPFGERHSAWHWYAGFNEIYNTGRSGMERADEIAPVAIDWIRRRGKEDNWFLHVNLWDPHTPYRTPPEFGNPFQNDPVPSWLTEDVRQRHWNGCGPHSAQEPNGFTPDDGSLASFPRQPRVIGSMAEVRQMFDGYDCGVRYADYHIGQIVDTLASAGVLDETAIIISADHGENLGELNIYGDHQTADAITTHVPLIVRWPNQAPLNRGRVDDGLYYQVDFAAALLELVGTSVPENWDGTSFAGAFKRGDSDGRDHLIVSQGAWSCQRSILWGNLIAIRSYHDGYHGFPETMLFDLKTDPHEQEDLAQKRPAEVCQGLAKLDHWYGEMTKKTASDPMWTVINEGGPLHTRGELPAYLDRLRNTGRTGWAELLSKSAI